ncbi:MAG: tetratricopeptide (TPR) repeat protein [Alphaproteobacteria bacterium]|jgi:tetratricopeptide (TPR) repeat protein
MLIRFSPAFLAPHKFVIALSAVLFGVSVWSAPSHAQTDAVSELAGKDPFILVRLAALSLETPGEQGEALAGLVEAELSRNLLKQARKELSRIEDRNWRARALTRLADYQREKGRIEAARQTLATAAKTVDTKAHHRKVNEALLEIAEKQGALGDFSAARKTAQRITNTVRRVETLFDIANRQAVAKNTKGAKTTLVIARKQTQKIKGQNADAARLALAIADKQTSLKDWKGVRATLKFADSLILNGAFANRDDALAELAAVKSKSGDHRAAMDMVRSINDVALRIRATSTVARAIAQSGDIDAAIPLFTLAFESMNGLRETENRYDLLAHLVRQQAIVGRLKDAFHTAGYIRDRETQARAFFEMAKILLEQRKYPEALKLTDYIPYIGLRARIFAEVALNTGNNGDPTGASALLARALEPTEMEPKPEFLELALEKLIAAQIRVGDQATSDALFKRMRELINGNPDDIDRVRLLTQLARAQGLQGLVNEAEITIAAAWRTAWYHRESNVYPDVTVRIVHAMISIGKILNAFDTAARIPLIADEDRRGSDQPRHQALRAVAEGTAAAGYIRMAIRAARKIKDPPSRAAALAAVAIGSTHQTH